MNTITMPIPSYHLLGDTLKNYPEGWKWPYTVFVREGFWKKQNEIIAGGSFEFNFPGHGTVTFRGRKYTFVPTAEYARAKGYPPKVEGSWG